jgi:entericidin B
LFALPFPAGTQAASISWSAGVPRYGTSFFNRRKGYTMKRLIALLLAASFAALATGCNTMQGLGRDVERGGEKIQKEAVENKKY